MVNVWNSSTQDAKTQRLQLGLHGEFAGQPSLQSESLSSKPNLPIPKPNQTKQPDHKQRHKNVKQEDAVHNKDRYYSLQLDSVQSLEYAL